MGILYQNQFSAENGIIGSQKLWSTVKPFLSSEGCIHNDYISIKINKLWKISLH